MKYKPYYNYDVYEDGTVYSHYVNKFLTQSVVQGYVQYTLYINNKIVRIKAHRLVAMLFLDLPENYAELVVNHKDGNKLNNHFTNLEWCTQYYNNYHARITGLNNISKSNSERWQDEDFRDRTRKHMSDVCLKLELNKGKNNPNFKHLIYDKDDNEYDRHSLAELLGISLSYCDHLLTKASRNEYDKIKNSAFFKYGIRVVNVTKS